MYFMLYIRFTGEEGDEVPVMDLLPTVEKLIEENCNVNLLTSELHVFSHGNLRCISEGRKRASSN